VIQGVLASSVQVVLERRGERFRSGSGVVVGPERRQPAEPCLILTSGHTFAGLTEADDSSLVVVFDRHRGAGTRAAARLLARRNDDQVDLALLEAPAPSCAVAPLGQPPALGDRIWVAGFPWGRQIRLVGGVVSQVTLDEQGTPRAGASLMVDASVVYGMSGSGVFEASSGRLVGLIEGYGTARVSFGATPPLQYIEVPVPGETYVTPLETIRAFLAGAREQSLVTPSARPVPDRPGRAPSPLD
jgi:hypothetical protein